MSADESKLRHRGGRAAVDDAEIAAFLMDVEAGTQALTPLQPPQWVYCGAVEYVAGNGWRLVVFNDCNEWDYIERLVTSDGRIAHIQGAGNPILRRYQPSPGVAWSRYGLPGYSTFLCRACGTAIQRTPGEGDTFACEACQHRD